MTSRFVSVLNRSYLSGSFGEFSQVFNRKSPDFGSQEGVISVSSKQESLFNCLLKIARCNEQLRLYRYEWIEHTLG